MNKAGALQSANKDLTIKADKINNSQSAILANQAMTITASELKNQTNGYIASDGNLEIDAKNVTNQTATIKTKADLSLVGDMVDNKAHALIYADGSSDYTLQHSLTNTESAISSKENLNLKAANITNQSQAMLESGKILTLSAEQTVINDAAAMTSAAKTEIAAQNIYHRNQSGIYADGLKLTAQEDIQNTDSLLVSNQDATLAAKNISNTEDAVLFAHGDIHLTAEQNILNQSSDIESKKDITIQAQQLTNEKKVFETDWDVTNQIISYRIPHWGGDYYNAIRTFNRNIHTGVIKAETAEGNILADGNIDIQSNVVNHYSKIVAGQDLNISGDRVENYGYQGTIVIADRGNDVQYWRYKHHGKHHIHCHMVYGSTTIPYSYDEIQEEPIARLGILGGNNKVTIQANTIDNKTYNAGKEEITYKTTEKNPLNISSVTLTDGTTKLKLNTDIIKLTQGQNAVNQMQDLVLNTKIFTINENPSAKYLIETNEKFANYQKFLSSDYLLNRVKSDPAKVAKRLGDGYYEQTLVTEQITNLTGRKYLSGYTSDLEQYKALMENGAVAAEKLNLTIGIALTPEQVAALTSDMVWLVETEVNGQTVLVPQIYLASIKAQDLTKDGALITGGEIELYAKDTLTNIGTIQADKTTLIKAGNLTNQTGQIKGQDINLEIDDTFANLSGNVVAKDNIKITAKDIINQTQTKETNYRELNQTELSETATITAQTGNVELIATNDIKNQSGKLSAGKDLSLSAGNNVEMTAVAKEKHVAVVYDKSSAQIDEVNHKQSQLNAENINIQAGKDIKLNAVTAKAQQNITTTAGNNIEITAAKDLSVFDVDDGEKGIHYTRDRIVDETVKGGNLDAGQNIQITAGQDVSIKGSQITSEQGKTKIQAQNDVKIENETEYHEKLHEEHRKKVGVLSSTTTKIYDYQNINQVKESYVNGNEVEIQTGKDTNITASIVAADKEINVKAGENININSASETSQSEYSKEVKKSGIFGSGGLGFTIGSQKQKDSYDNQAVEQVGSTIGSIQGNVNLESGKDVDIKASEVIAGKDINITGENVTIENGDNTYNAQEKHEFKQSGLSVSLGGKTIDAAQSVVAPLERAGQVEDERLKQLYQYKAVEAVKENKEILSDLANGKTDIGLNVSLGTSKSESSYQSDTKVNQGSTIHATGDVNIKATEKDITVKGSAITGENVNLEAKENINVIAGTNKNVGNGDSSQSSASIGVSIGFSGITGINAGYNKANGEVKENAETHVASTITAKDTLTTKSGQDTNIIGSKLEGETINMEVGKDLNIESLQDKETYDEKNNSSGFNFSADIKANANTGKNQFQNGGITGGKNKGKTNSTYESVTDQAGIYAGKGGFDIEVGKNTDLKGAVIASEADASKNKLSTDTLTYSDIENKAEYSASNSGFTFDSKGEIPITPNQEIPVKGEAESTTKSAIAEGTIEIRSNENQNISNLSRNTQEALNKLEKIFDAKTVKEQQELADLFAKEGFKLVGDIAIKQYKNAIDKARKYPESSEEYKKLMKEAEKWDEGGIYKSLLHGVVGGVTAQFAGGSFTGGFKVTSLHETIQKELINIKNPLLHQMASALIGGALGNALGESQNMMAAIAADATKYNWLTHQQQREFLSKIKDAKTEAEVISVIGYYAALSQYNNDNPPSEADRLNELEKIEGDLLEALKKYTSNFEHGLNYCLNELIVNIYASPEIANMYREEFNKKGADAPYYPIGTFEGTITKPLTPEKTLWEKVQSGEITPQWDSSGSGYTIDSQGYKIYINGLSRGDYEYQHGAETFIDNTGRYFIHAEDGDYPVWSIPLKGDQLANDHAFIYTNENGVSFARDEDGKYWYTTKEGIFAGYSLERQELLWKCNEAEAIGDKLGYFVELVGDDLGSKLTSYKKYQYNLAIQGGMTEELAEEFADVATMEAVGATAGGIIGTTGSLAANGTIGKRIDELFAKTIEGSSKALNGIKVSSKIEKNADEINNWWKVEKGYDKPPYKPGTVVQEVELQETTTFVRVYDDVNSFQKGGWVMKKEDIAGLTPAQIKDKFALPEIPKYITDVTIPGGTKVRVGEANEVSGWGKGGGTQIDLMGQRGIGEEFSNPRPLE